MASEQVRLEGGREVCHAGNWRNQVLGRRKSTKELVKQEGQSFSKCDQVGRSKRKSRRS